jgi:hypothetical protein
MIVLVCLSDGFDSEVAIILSGSFISKWDLRLVFSGYSKVDIALGYITRKSYWLVSSGRVVDYGY